MAAGLRASYAIPGTDLADMLSYLPTRVVGGARGSDIAYGATSHGPQHDHLHPSELKQASLIGWARP
eukprot:3462106-Rhodomonas_salina.1